jgi:dTDP-glucose 4,6-dehydratase
MRILITGAAGFIGSHLCEHFLEKGHEIVALDNLLTGSRENLAHLEGRITFREADICRTTEIEGPLDRVFHFASPASPRDYLRYPLETLDVGSNGTKSALQIALTKGARFLLASTSEVYGDPSLHPQPETYWGNVNPVGPRAVYDEAKRFAEATVMAYHRTHGLQTRIVRIFNTYGPRMKPGDGRVIPEFSLQVLTKKPITVYGNGAQTRSFCYVKDLVEGIDRLMESDYIGPVNLGNPGEFTILELAQVLMELTGTTVPIIHLPLPEDDPKRRKPDIDLAGRILSWRPHVSLREGLGPTLKWFSAHCCPAQGT